MELSREATWRTKPERVLGARTRAYQPGEIPLQTNPRPGLRSRHQAFHQKTNSEAALSSSQLKIAEPTKRARVEEEVQTNENMEDLNETRDVLDRVRKALARTEEDRDMWGDCLRTATRSKGKHRTLEVGV